MSEQRKEVLSFVCSSSFASVRGEEVLPDGGGGRQPEVVQLLSFSLFGLPSFDLVLSAAEEVASCDGEESSFFEPEPVQGGAAY